MNEWMNEILYSACIQPEAVQSAEHRELLSKACYHSNSNSVSWEIYSWAAIEAHQAIFIPSKFALCAKYTHIVDFLGSRRMGTAPTSIEIFLRPTLGQSDEPSDIRGSLSPTSVYSTWQSQAVTHPIMNRVRRCLTSVIEPITMSERRIPYIYATKSHLGSYDVVH